jgi:hypothetical protein
VIAVNGRGMECWGGGGGCSETVNRKK